MTKKNKQNGEKRIKTSAKRSVVQTKPPKGEPKIKAQPASSIKKNQNN